MNIKNELFIGAMVLLISFFLFGEFDVLEKLVAWSNLHEQYEIDEIISTSFVLILLLFIFSMRRHHETVRKTKNLQKALDEIEVLKGIIPICAYCKKIRDDEGIWNQLESYVRSHSSAEFSHGICPECYKKQLDEIETDLS
ncbi:MAG: hypothetical protein ACI8ZB_000600 [Desulforhopalus sp.]|jgi:hypothetical protein